MKELDRVHEKLETMDDKLGQIIVVQVEQAADLKHHIFRTDLAEKHLRHLEEKVTPLTEFHAKFNGIMRFVGVLATGVAVAAGVVKVLEFLL